MKTKLVLLVVSCGSLLLSGSAGLVGETPTSVPRVIEDLYATNVSTVTKAKEKLVTIARQSPADRQEVIRDLMAGRTGALSVKAITTAFTERHGDQYDYKITHRWIGGLLRRKLHIQPQKSHGTYVIPIAEMPHLDVLCRKFGVGQTPPRDDDETG